MIHEAMIVAGEGSNNFVVQVDGQHSRKVASDTYL